MNYERRFPQRTVRLLGSRLCLAGVVASLLIAPVSQASNSGPRLKRPITGQRNGQSGNDKARKVTPPPPQTGAPAATLPDLNEAKTRPAAAPRTPEPIPSTLRSRRKARRGPNDKTAFGTRPKEIVAQVPPAIHDSAAKLKNGPIARRLHHGRPVRADFANASAPSSLLPAGINSPTSLSVTATSATVIHLVWTASASAVDHYQVQRSASLAGPFTFLATAATTNFDDLSVATNHSYLYRVLAVNSFGVQSLPSNMAFGTAITFLDEPLNVGVVVQAQHFYDLRTAVNAVRALVPGMSTGSWSQGNLYHATIYGTDVQELRDQLDEALGALSVQALDYEDPQLGHGATLIRKKHVEQLRERSTRGSSASAGAASGGSESAIARLDPFNQTGDQLQARDCEWNVELLNLPGRAGLDLGLGLSYSSLVWTRALSYMYFDEDNGSPSPGFRLGFPVIQSTFFDPQAGVDARLLITSSGRRVELRRVGTTNVYEAADSSYLQLIDYGSSLLLKSIDGTQMSYAKSGDDWHCTSIEDRNGNLILVSYDGYGEIQNITDTLGRVITFNYDSNANLNTITQQWNGQTQTWASFGWGTKVMHPSFGLPAVGTYDGETIPVLTQVGLPDGSRYNFEYMDRGQVNIIRRYSSDNVQRSATTYSYSSPSSDCPRLNDARVTADNWTGINGVPSEVVTQFADGGDGSHVLTLPDGSIHKEFYGGSGWQRGLVAQTEDWSGGTRQKWTTTAFTQDNTSVNYQTNPRVIETNIYDVAGNRRRTTIDYDFYAQYGLPHIVHEFAADGITEIRRSYTDYNLNQAFLDRRIIGLVSTQRLYDQVSGQSQQKTTYTYDSTTVNSQATTAPGHDQSYDAAVTVRGNVTGVSRWDVNDIDNGNKALTSAMSYNAAGSLLSATDPAGHANSVAYGDAFSDNNNSRGTFAYPTTLTDADGYQSTVQYNFDFGAKTRIQGPPPNNQPNGVIQTFTYDSAGRIERTTTANNGAYTRYDYQPNYIQSWSSINNVADEAYSVQFFDGAGRIILAGGNHPGSTGGNRLVNSIYDVMGRLVQQSNPTETNSDRVPVGDDLAGWLYIQQTYDWKGRPLVTTNTDGTQKYASYSACGCAGSEVVTSTDEVGRQQKVYSDALGRTARAEVLNGNSVYSTTTNTFNALDQVSLLRVTDNATGNYQDTTMSFDGYGRLQSKHVPEQNAGTATVYAYNADDTVSSVTDARGASATYTYNNNRHLVNAIIYSAPSGVTPTANVSLGYDAVGNRTSMSDGLGAKTYSYNQLSQLMSETRTFNGVGTFTLSYDYNLAGELKKITDATNMTINYGFDNSGRLSSVTGSDSLYAGVSNYASNFQYRAWGGLKAMTDGKGYVSSLLYNSKLRPSHFEISGNVANQNYDYYNDGRISVVHNTTDQNFDRAYSYDNSGRLSEAKSGGNVNGYQYAPIPFYETFGYDAFSNLTARQSQSWGGQTDDSDAATYTNNRRGGWGYDADGRNTTIDTRTNTFDAVGQQTLMVAQQVLGNGHQITVSQTSGYDGDGARIQDISSSVITYYLRSSVLGGAIIEELDNAGQKKAGYVCSPGGQLLATQTPASPYMVTWKHNTPAGTSEYTANSYNTATSRTEFDSLGADVSLSAPADPPPDQGPGDVGVGHFGGLMDKRWSDFFNLESGFIENGFSMSTSEAMFYVNFGTGRRLTDIVGVTGKDVANALGASFALPGVPFATPGVEGIPGHQTIEYKSVNDGGESIVVPVPTAYSGTASISGSIVMLASSVQAQQPTAQNPFPTFNNDDLKRVDDSIKLAKEMTDPKKHKECDEALKAYGIPSLSALINGMTPNGNIFDGRTSTLTGPIGKNNATESIAAYFKENKTSVGAAVFDNTVTKRGPVTFLGDYFFNPASTQWLEQQRAIIMLHEMVHQVGGKKDAAFGSSKQLSQKIIDKCYPALKGKLGGVG
jgi:YD repeat-containing protein